MFKAATTLLFFLYAFLSFTASAETGYISDKVYVYLHTGPGVKFRIIGSVVAGSKIDIVERSSDGKYTKIVDDKQRTGWVKSEFTSQKISLQAQFNSLTEELQQVSQQQSIKMQQLTEQQADLDSSNVEYINEIAELKQTISSLNNELDTTKASNKKALAQLVGEDQDIKIKWLVHGGVLVIISLLLGIFLANVLGKRKKSGNWS